MELRIQKVQPQDVSTLTMLIKSLAEYEKLPGPDARAHNRMMVYGFGSKPYFEALIAYKCSEDLLIKEPVGYAIYYFGYSTFLAAPILFLEDLFVQPVARGEGIGKQLFLKCAEEARKKECARMEWTVLDWNTEAKKFYERLGAQRMSEWEHYRLDAQGIAQLTEQKDPNSE